MHLRNKNALCSARPELEKAFALTREDDGSFWMSEADFFTHFEHVHVRG